MPCRSFPSEAAVKVSVGCADVLSSCINSISAHLLTPAGPCVQLETAQQKLQTQLQDNETSIIRLKEQIEAEGRGKEDSVRQAAVYKNCVSPKSPVERLPPSLARLCVSAGTSAASDASHAGLPCRQTGAKCWHM